MDPGHLPDPGRGILVEPVATQGLVATTYLPDYRLNGADWAGLAVHLTDVILSSVEIGPRGKTEGPNRVRKGLVAAKWKKGLRVLLCIGGGLVAVVVLPSRLCLRGFPIR